jgi:hypothetical protein
VKFRFLQAPERADGVFEDSDLAIQRLLRGRSTAAGAISDPIRNVKIHAEATVAEKPRQFGNKI